MDYENRIAQALVEALELEVQREEPFPVDRLLFGPPESGGFGLDSLASLTITATLSDRFDLTFDDVERDDLQTVRTLAAYVRRKKDV
jgi:acyl carrier protein